MKHLAPWLLATVLMACLTPVTRAEPPRKIVLIAGALDAGHPRGTHEYERAVTLLKHCLDTSPNLKGVRAEVHFNGWPTDPSTLDDADTIVVISNGSDRDEQSHPLLVGDRLKVIEKQMARGCGLVTIHWTTFFPDRVADRVLEWTGGYFDYQGGAAANGWESAIQHWEAEVRPGTPGHPVLRGVGPFKTLEEFYYQIKFRENDARLKPILVTRAPNVEGEQVVAWAVERAGGGRGLGFTGGHYYANWFVPSFRRMVLNAIVWTAHAEVPDGGVTDTLGDKPIRALILTGHDGPFHDWRTTSAALKESLERDPRFIVEVTENIEDLATRPLDGYALLVQNYCNWDRPGLSDAAKERLVKYLQAGGGLSVIHFANGAFHPSLPNNPNTDWPDYRRIVRRVWDHAGGSGHDAFGPFRVEVTPVKHPITEGLEAFETVDELYFNQRGEDPIEPLATARSKVTGKDEPLAWAYPYGEGRVFQTVLGHSAESVKHASELIRRGSLWAAGAEVINHK